MSFAVWVRGGSAPEKTEEHPALQIARISPDFKRQLLSTARPQGPTYFKAMAATLRVDGELELAALFYSLWSSNQRDTAKAEVLSTLGLSTFQELEELLG